MIWLALATVSVKLAGANGGCGVLLEMTVKFQFAPPLLSHAPAPLLKTQFRMVVLAGMLVVNCQALEAALNVIAGSGETMFVHVVE